MVIGIIIGLSCFFGMIGITMLCLHIYEKSDHQAELVILGLVAPPVIAILFALGGIII